MVQIAWQIHDIKGDLIEVKNYIIKPEGFTIPYNSEKIHGISTELAHKKGLPLKEVLSFFTEALNSVEFIIGHNISFDNNIVGCEFLRSGMANVLESKTSIDTKEESTDFVNFLEEEEENINGQIYLNCIISYLAKALLRRIMLLQM